MYASVGVLVGVLVGLAILALAAYVVVQIIRK